MWTGLDNTRLQFLFTQHGTTGRNFLDYAAFSAFARARRVCGCARYRARRCEHRLHAPPLYCVGWLPMPDAVIPALPPHFTCCVRYVTPHALATRLAASLFYAVAYPAVPAYLRRLFTLLRTCTLRFALLPSLPPHPARAACTQHAYTTLRCHRIVLPLRSPLPLRCAYIPPTLYVWDSHAQHRMVDTQLQKHARLPHTHP